MKNIRLFYKKDSAARFISHLDTMRTMTRLLRRAGLPVWYTEGFNPHLYITFALPLTLGFKSEYEIADIRLTDDNYPIDSITDSLNRNAPEGFFFFEASEPVKKLSELKSATFKIEFEDLGKLAVALKEFIASGHIEVEKKTKKGALKIINAAEDIIDYKVLPGENTTLIITLPAGPEKTVNPELITNKFLSENGECYTTVTRLMLNDSSGNPLK